MEYKEAYSFVLLYSKQYHKSLLTSMFPDGSAIIVIDYDNRHAFYAEVKNRYKLYKSLM